MRQRLICLFHYYTKEGKIFFLKSKQDTVNVTALYSGQVSGVLTWIDPLVRKNFGHMDTHSAHFTPEQSDLSDNQVGVMREQTKFTQKKILEMFRFDGNLFQIRWVYLEIDNGITLMELTFSFLFLKTIFAWHQQWTM